MLSHVDGFRSDEEFLAGCSPDSRNAVRKQLAELRQFGYLVRERVRGEDGKVTTQSVLYDVSQMPESPVEPSAPSRQGVAGRSDQGRYSGDGSAPRNTPWRDGVTGGNVEGAKVEPPRYPGGEAVRSAKTRVSAGGAVSPPVGVHSGDQREETKKISQSARVREAVRWLRAEYGLTDDEAATVWEIARSRTSRPVQSPVPYLRSMRQDPETGEIKGDLADIVAAVQEASRPPSAPASPPPPEPLPEPVPVAPVQPPILASVQEPVEVDERGIPAGDERAAARARFEEINAGRRAKSRKRAT